MKTLLTIEHCWMYNPITCKRDKKCPCINMPAIKGECIRESSTCYYYKDRVPLDTSKPYISGVTNEYNGKLFSAGFEMVFENGLTIVIRFGKEHYCTNYMKVEPYTCEDDKNSLISHTAEVFVYKPIQMVHVSGNTLI